MLRLILEPNRLFPESMKKPAKKSPKSKRAPAPLKPEEIKALRLKWGFSQAVFGGLCGLSASSAANVVSKWEAGDVAPAASVHKLLRAYEGGYRPPEWPSTGAALDPRSPDYDRRRIPR